MSHKEQRDFIQKTKDHFPEYFDYSGVIEIGSLNINGTIRDFFTDKCSYWGVDLIMGPGVDVVAKGKDIPLVEKFDTVVSTECFEHDSTWKETFANMIKMCKKGGMVLFTCASTGRREHGTTRTTPSDSPATTDYYENRTKEDFENAFPISEIFSKHLFEYNPVTCDLYFWGIKKI